MTDKITPDPYVQLFNLGTNFALGFWSDHEQKKYNDKVTALQNAYVEAQDRQNLQLYYFNRDKIIADRLEAIEAIEAIPPLSGGAQPRWYRFYSLYSFHNGLCSFCTPSCSPLPPPHHCDSSLLLSIFN